MVQFEVLTRTLWQGRWTSFRYQHGIWLKSLKKSTTDPPGRELKPGNPEYEAGMLRFSSKESVLSFFSCSFFISFFVLDVALFLSVLSSFCYNI